MDYDALAHELLEQMHVFHKMQMRSGLDDGMHGKKFVLCFIADKESNVQPSEIVRKMHVSPARVAQTLNGMEEKGWIIREVDKTDRRKVLISATPEGIDLAKAHMQSKVEATSRMLRGLGEADAKEYVRIMGRLTKLMAAENAEKEG